MKRKKVIIMGAAGRDFHNFNTSFRDNDEYEVVAFTAYQIPNIENRTYPPELAGKLYPHGIPIYPESQLSDLLTKDNIDIVVFSYSDVSHEYVMHKASLVNAMGGDFYLLGGRKTLIPSTKPVIAVTAVRTGCGKSQVSRKIVRILREKNLKIVAIRHPMPYGDLLKQQVQRFASYEDMDSHNCTIEEREEYEPYIEQGMIIYAGVDYEKVLREAEKEADIILWDGGNNDTPFIKPDMHIVVADPHRPNHELSYYPGETNVRMASIVIINKISDAKAEDIKLVEEHVKTMNPNAIIIKSNSIISIDDPLALQNKRVLVIEDGPTVTHGGMPYGAGYLAAKKFNAAKIIDPRPYAYGTLKETFNKWTHLKEVVPAMGYGKDQMHDLIETINASECDTVVCGTPIDLARLLHIQKPVIRVHYDIKEIGHPTLEDSLDIFINKMEERTHDILY